MIFTKTEILCLIIVSILIIPIGTKVYYKIFGTAISALTEMTRLQTAIFPTDYPSKPNMEGGKETYDFIIVGSGPSGCVLANRLTENPKIKVLLIESGFEPSLISRIPVTAGALQFTSFDWGYMTQPSTDWCKGCEKRRMKWAHGHVLGGSSVINYMIFVRGNAHDFDRWAAMGNPGWTYRDVLPYFKKVEDARIGLSDPGYRHRGGPVTVSDVPFRSQISNLYISANIEAGYPYVDYNGEKQLGVSYIQGILRDGLRCSADVAYLQPIRHRKNLTIRTSSRVTKVIIDKNTKVARGVEFLNDYKRRRAYAKKEVILSAGSFNSAQLLMLSGVGPKAHLEDVGIPVIQDLPAGQKLYDHAAFPAIMYEVNESVVVKSFDTAIDPRNYLGLLTGSGTFTTLGGVEALTFLKTNVSDDPTPDYPDIEFLMLGGAISTDYGVVYRKMFNIPSKMYDTLYRPLEQKNVYQVTPMLLHPKSYGHIKLDKANPEGSPLLYANYFSDPDNFDIKTYIAGIREFQRINSMPSMQKVGAKMVDIPVPGCESEIFDSDEYWECALRTIVGTYYHVVGACKMGPKTDPEAVVDHRLKVHGIKQLRVVDVSIIPEGTSSHTVAPAYMIGEKAADMIKMAWNM